MSTPVEPVTPQVNEHGYPDSTPVAEMTTEHQAAYWKHHARQHEARWKSGPDADELKRLRDRDAELKRLEDERLTAEQRAQAEKDAASAEAATAKAAAETATRRALLLEIALDKGLTVAQAERLRGATKEELEADADALKSLFGGSNDGQSAPAPRSGGPRGNDAGAGKPTTATGADLYRQRHAKN